jgi:hypothetical protein
MSESKICNGKTKKGKECLNLCIGKYCHLHKYQQILLEGPIYVAEFKNTDKHIYLFGDYHYYNQRCFPKTSENKKINIISLIEDAIKSKKHIDIFLEAEYNSKEFKSYIPKYTNVLKVKLGKAGFDFNIPTEWKNKLDYLTNKKSELLGLINKYSNCLQNDKTKCSSVNTHFHYTDIRTLKIDFYVITMYVLANFDSINKDYQNIRDEVEVKENKNLYDTIIQILEAEKSNFPVEINSIFKKVKIDKQYVNVKDSEVAEKISDIIFQQNINFQNIVKLNKVDIQNIIDEYNDENIHPLVLFCIDWWYFQVALFDAYTMFRVFRSYKDKSTSNNIIIYAGNLHIQKYADILSELDFDFTFESIDQIGNLNDKSEPFQCVDITGMTLPLFN